MLSALAVLCLLIGTGFFIAGTLGVVRFNSALARLHAVTKADNLGLGWIIIGLMLLAPNWAVVLKLALIWSLVLLASAMLSHLIGQRCYQQTEQTHQEAQ